mmetsp:Transcript_63353/g.136239  ORF Transcript_63353/g.136239 Transcript_63353/m.136239 type:complete len:213 (+) Transcript_63353:699-1337(+)
MFDNDPVVALALVTFLRQLILQGTTRGLLLLQKLLGQVMLLLARNTLLRNRILDLTMRCLPSAVLINEAPKDRLVAPFTFLPLATEKLPHALPMPLPGYLLALQHFLLSLNVVLHLALQGIPRSPLTLHLIHRSLKLLPALRLLAFHPGQDACNLLANASFKAAEAFLQNALLSPQLTQGALGSSCDLLNQALQPFQALLNSSVVAVSRFTF